MFRDGAARLLVFRVGSEHFAVPLSDVDEVIDAQPIQRVPDAAATVLGVTSVRGVLLTVYDPRPVLHVHGSVDAAMLLFGERVPNALPYVLAFAAGNFLYVAMADLIPTLHRGTLDRNALRQLLLIALGIATIVSL